MNDKKKKKDEVKEIRYEKEHKLEGLMRYLTKQTGRNINDNGTIKIIIIIQEISRRTQLKVMFTQQSRGLR